VIGCEAYRDTTTYGVSASRKIASKARVTTPDPTESPDAAAPMTICKMLR
jgi:hypothetical protein